MIYQPVIVAIAILTLVIIILLMALIIKKISRDLLYARRLWLKDHYRTHIEEFLSRNNKVKLPPLTEAESQKYRPIIQGILQELMKRANGIQQRKIQKLFESLGYLKYHVENLRNPKYLQRASSAEILGEIKSKKAVDTLTLSLQDPEEAVRLTCLRALGMIGGKKADKALVEALQDHDRHVPARVAEALHLAGLGAVAPLINLLDAPDHITRAFAAQVLGEIGDKRAFKALVRALLDDSVDVRVKATASLGQLGDRRAQYTLEKVLEDPEWPVRSAAAKALGQLKDPASCHLLAQAMTDPEWWVRANAAQALADMGKPGEKALIKMLVSDDRFAQEKAAETLQLCGAVDGYMLQLASKDHQQTHQAYEALKIFARLGIISPFTHFLNESKDIELRCAIIAFLGETGDELAYKTISKYINDGEEAVRETAKNALQQIQNRKWASIGGQVGLERMVS